MLLNRRSFVELAGIAVMMGAAKAAAAPLPDPEVSVVQWRYGISQFGSLKYPSGFRHFDYVNPGAPKGGRVRQGALRRLLECDQFGASRARVRARI